MPIISSSYKVEDHLQKDGTVWVKESHYTTNKIVNVSYLAPPGANTEYFQEAIQSRIEHINNKITIEAFYKAISEDISPDMNDLPLPIFGAMLREHFAGADAQEKCRMCWWFVRRVNAGDVTQEQCRLALGVAVEEWDDMWNNTIIPCSNAWSAVLSATEA